MERSILFMKRACLYIFVFAILTLTFVPAFAIYKNDKSKTSVPVSSAADTSIPSSGAADRSDAVRTQLMENTRWIIEFEEPPVLSKKVELVKQGMKGAPLTSSINDYRGVLFEKHADFKNKLPDNIKVTREFKDVLNGFAVEASAEAMTGIGGQSTVNIKRVLPDYLAYPLLMDTIPLINADDVWELPDPNNPSSNLTGEGITIAILDSGIDYTHADFGACTTEEFLNGECAKFAGGYNIWDDDPDPMDYFGHGTHVASIAAGDGVLRGVAPDARIYAYRVLGNIIIDGNPEHLGTLSTVIVGVERAMDPNQDGDFSDHADIIHMSLGVPGSPDDLWSQVVDNAFENGAVVTVSAGNSGPGYFSGGCPGCARNAITVGATCKPSQIGGSYICPSEIAYFSSRGPTVLGTAKPDVVAPGHLICAARFQDWSPGGLYQPCVDDEHILLSGTSMSGPVVAGVAVLMKQAHPDWTPQEIKNTIKGTSTDLGFNLLVQGAGRVDALEAVLQDHPYPTAVLDNREDLFVDGLIDIYGSAYDEDFDYFTLEYGEGVEPSSWSAITTGNEAVVDGLLGTLDTSQITVESFAIRLTVFNTSGQKSVDELLLLKRQDSWREGWPRRIGTDITFEYFAPAVGDLDNDGYSEIVVGSAGMFDSKVYVWDHNGNLLDGWPQEVNMMGGSDPALGDVDGDGDLEIVYKSSSFLIEQKSTVYVWNEDGTPLNENWPKDIPWEFISLTHPVLEDIDNDGKDEIIISTYSLGETASIKIWNEDGSEILGPWNSINNPSINPAVGDLDGDGDKDMVFIDSTSTDYVLTAWDIGTGEVLDHFPVTLPSQTGTVISPVVADIDRDGQYEIIVGFTNCKTYVYDNHKFINILPFSPYYCGGGASVVSRGQVIRDAKVPSVTDIDGDGDLEVIGYINSSVYAWEFDGSVVDGWPKSMLPYDLLSDFHQVFSKHGGAIADVDNDGENELVIVLYTGQQVNNVNDMRSIGTYVFVVDIGGDPDMVDWATFQNNMKRTGFAHSDFNFCGNSTLEYGEACDDANANANDGCNQSCKIEYGSVCAGEPSVCSDTQIYVDTFQLSWDLSHQRDAAIYDNKVVWKSNGSEKTGIYLYGILAQEELAIETSPGIYQCPTIYKNKVAWLRNEGATTGNVWLYDTQTGIKTQITTDGEYYGCPVGLYEDKIVYSSSKSGNLDIYLYDLSAQAEIQITSDPSLQTKARIDNDKIVWQDNRNGNYDIYLYDLATQQEAQITADPSSQTEPFLHGDKIVWTDSRNGNQDIYLYDLTAKEEMQITSDPSEQSDPAIYGNKIVWTDNHNGGKDTYLYDLATGEERFIAPIYSARIYEDKIVGTHSGESLDIYMAKMYPYDSFSCGDTDHSGSVDIDDVVFLIDHLSADGPTPEPLVVADADADSYADIDDVHYLLSYIFQSGLPPMCSGGDVEALKD
ncbi:MAG: S8 family serine peptidase [Candidatus Omnitrophota bacterium]